MHEALFYKKITGESSEVACLLCPHGCIIAPGSSGICRSRVNISGKLYSKTYGLLTALAVDPIEKKPLYHFHPAQDILSAGSYGCNLQCAFCQNWQISQQEALGSEYSPEQVVELALARKSFAVAYTYNEPLVNYEFVKETAVLAHAAGLKNVLVTNGFVNPQPLEELVSYIDGVNLDIKAGRDEFYRDICGGLLAPVLRSAQIFAASTHLEITTLLIPGYNNNLAELEWLSSWIASNCGEDTPAHISAYFPNYRFTVRPTGREEIAEAVAVFRKYLNFVYAGNVDIGSSSTFCKECATELVRRRGYNTEIIGLDRSGLCSKCSADNNFSW